MRTVARSLDWMDRHWGNALARGSAGAPHVLVALFHAVAAEADAARLLAPEQSVTPDDLRRFLDAVLSAGYQPAAIGDLAEPASEAQPGKRVAITFDDGYFNNHLALGVLAEFHVPAAFFISTSHVMHGHAFWWDVAARMLRARGASRREIRRRLEALKRLPPADIALELSLRGADAAPLGDVDRPFTPRELRDFAASRWVTLGNHTAEHTILTQCSAADAAAAMAHGKAQLQELTGVQADAIAYPDGAFSAPLAHAARSTGHRLGFTCEPRSNRAPLDADALLAIGRHIIHPQRDYRAQLNMLAAPTVLPGARLRAHVRATLQRMRARAAGGAGPAADILGA